MKDRLRGNPKMYRIGGFPLAFQFWFYECCQRVKPQIAHRLEERIPRILGWKAESKPRYSLVSKHITKMKTDKLYLKNISPTELEKENMIKDVFFLANGPEKENTTDKVMRNENVDEDATGNENVKEKCNKKENMNEQTNWRGKQNVKEKELLKEREVFDETYIKRFNTYVDFFSPPRHIFDKQIRNSGDPQLIDANFKKLFDGQAILNKEIGTDKFVELFKALEIKNKNQEKETNNYGEEIGQVSKDGDTNSTCEKHLQDNQQDKIDVHDHDNNVDDDKQEYRNVNDADENIQHNNMDMVSGIFINIRYILILYLYNNFLY
ncbi:uncharacterized protein [Nicotiana tomentosiformis]|uniref:uncharacterized protein isoform X1 n=1 Tax=Nicotiana tomentosiformis TaxID=4098 RepID=UPI00388CE7C5